MNVKVSVKVNATDIEITRNNYVCSFPVVCALLHLQEVCSFHIQYIPILSYCCNTNIKNVQ